MIRHQTVRRSFLRSSDQVGSVEDTERKKSRKSLPMEVLGLIYFLLLLSFGVVLVWQPAQIARMSDEINQLESQLSDLKLKNEGLKKTLSEVESLAYVEKVATEQLGMVPPSQVKTVAYVPPATQTTQNNPETTKIEKTSGILSAIERIAQVLGIKSATAKGAH